MASRPVNAVERYLLTHYQHLMSPSDRMIARSLVAAEFDLDRIRKQVWQRVWLDFPGIDRNDPWKLPVQISLRLLKDYKDQIKVPEAIS